MTALRGELSSNTVNAPMVPAEVLAELQPYIVLAQGLGKVAVQLVAEQGFNGEQGLRIRGWVRRVGSEGCESAPVSASHAHPSYSTPNPNP